LIILITGPESTGKSTLSRALSDKTGYVLLSEYARTYLEENGPSYTFEDLKKIAKTHVNQFRQLESSGQDVILDTYLMNLHIWSEVKFGRVDTYIAEQLKIFKPDLTLLLKPDIAWAPDPLRENENNRDELFDRFESMLTTRQDKFVIIEGDNRLEQVLLNIESSEY